MAARLGAENLETPGGVVLRMLFHPAEGVVGGDFLGTATAGEAVWFVIGDVAGHGLEAAVKALRLKDLVLSAAHAGLRLSDALALGNALLWADPSGESLATVFVALYGEGVLRYANAGHLPGHLLNGGTATAPRGRDGDAGGGGGNQMLAPTGPLLGLVEHPVIEEREVALAPGFRVVAYTDGLLEAYGRLGGLGDQEVLGLVVQGEFALLHERLNTRWPEPLGDDIAAIEFLVPATG